MKRFIPDKFLNLLFKVRNIWRDEYATKSYSQEGEDLILRRIFEKKPVGFYIDIGAHHPKRFSNTHIFHKRGWRGINIDALPGSMAIFKKHRPRDINLEIPVSERIEELTYYEFNEPALNSFSEELSNIRNDSEKYRIISKKKMTALPLADILDKYLPNGQVIDFMTIDVEGWDLKVLKSNDWRKYQPKIVLVEIDDSDLNDMDNDPTVRFLREQGYLVYAKTVKTWIFYRQPLEGLD